MSVVRLLPVTIHADDRDSVSGIVLDATANGLAVLTDSAVEEDLRELGSLVLELSVWGREVRVPARARSHVRIGGRDRYGFGLEDSSELTAVFRDVALPEIDRRRSPRFAFQEEDGVRVRVEEEISQRATEGLLLNLSSSGACFLADDEDASVELGARVIARFTLDSVGETVSFPATLCRRNGRVGALEFDPESAGFLSLAAKVESFVRERLGDE